jgi:hypothetical protein
MFPPGEESLTAWVTPPVSSLGLPPDSMTGIAIAVPSQSTPMIANTAYPWRLSLTIRPNVNANANGMIRMA